MEHTITATDLARSLSDVLNRVHYRGERFVVERNGERVAEIVPAAAEPGITLREFLSRLDDIPWPDSDYFKELAELRAAQPPLEIPEWE